MNVYLIVAATIALALVSLLFSCLTYALRDFSRSRLAEYFERTKRPELLEPTVSRASDLAFTTAVFRLFCNILILICVLRLFQEIFEGTRYSRTTVDVLAIVVTGIITLVFSAALPVAIAKYAGEAMIGFFASPLHASHWALMPVTKVMHAADALVAKAAGAGKTVNGHDAAEKAAHHIEEEILSAVEEGAKEGIVDEQERGMIESVIQFRDTTAGQIMTARPEIVGLERAATLDEVKRILEESGHSRVPVYEGTLDHIVGILYARDLLKYLGQPPDQFDIRSAIRHPFYVPQGKSLRDLLKDFRLQKVHMAVVLDEYGGTAGLVTIEDILEELVGEISDEHEPHEPAMLKRLSDTVWESDARTYIDELNHVVGLNLPEDAGYETLGGFVSTTVGRIPETGATFEHNNVRYTILDAEPQKVNRVRLELIPTPQLAETGAPGRPE